MESRPSKQQRRAYRRRALKDEVGDSFARTSQERLSRWSRREYNPGYLRAALLFGFLGLLGYGLFRLEGWDIAAGSNCYLLGAGLFVVGLLLIYLLRDVPFRLGFTEHQRVRGFLRRRRLRLLAAGVIGAVLLAVLIDTVLLGPRLLVVLTLFMWTGASVCSLLLALTNRIRFCPTCALYGNFVRERNGWVCTTCGQRWEKGP